MTLECRLLLTFQSSPLPRTSPDLPIVYKKSIILFRSLYTLVNLLPAYKLYRQLRKRNQQNSLKMVCRITTGRLSSSSTIGLETPLVDDERLMRHDFVPVLTPLGSLSVHVSYRQNCRFRVDDTETLLSSRFIDMDENYFTPTMARFPSQTNSPHNASKAAPSVSPLSNIDDHLLTCTRDQFQQANHIVVKSFQSCRSLNNYLMMMHSQQSGLWFGHRITKTHLFSWIS